MDAGLIAVVEQYDVARKAVQHAYLEETQGRTGVRYDILNATLVHRNHIRIAFHHIDQIQFGYGFLGLEDTIEFTFLMIDLRIGRVDIFLLHTLGACIQQSAAKSRHLAADTYPREDDTSRKAVHERSVVPLETQSSLHEELLLVASLQCCLRQCVALTQAEAQLELPDDVVTEAAAAEILHTDGQPVDILMQNALKVFARPFVDDEHRLTFAFRLPFLVGQFPLAYFYMVFVGQPAQSLGIGHLLVFHHEPDHVSGFSTGKALIDSLHRRYGERRRGVVVERTQALIARAALLQRHELRHDIDDVRRIHDAVYGVSVYHRSFYSVCAD